MVFAPNQIYDKLVLSRQFLHPDKYAAKWYFSKKFYLPAALPENATL